MTPVWRKIAATVLGDDAFITQSTRARDLCEMEALAQLFICTLACT